MISEHTKKIIEDYINISQTYQISAETYLLFRAAAVNENNHMVTNSTANTVTPFINDNGIQQVNNTPLPQPIIKDESHITAFQGMNTTPKDIQPIGQAKKNKATMATMLKSIKG